MVESNAGSGSLLGIKHQEHFDQLACLLSFSLVPARSQKQLCRYRVVDSWELRVFLPHGIRERKPLEEDLVYQDSKAPVVRLLDMPKALFCVFCLDLWCNVARSSTLLPDLRLTLDPNHAEVDQLRDEVSVNEYVVWLDVSVSKLCLMAKLDALDNHVQLELEDVQRHCDDRAPLSQCHWIQIHEHHVRWDLVLTLSQLHDEEGVGFVFVLGHLSEDCPFPLGLRAVVEVVYLYGHLVQRVGVQLSTVDSREFSFLHL